MAQLAMRLRLDPDDGEYAAIGRLITACSILELNLNMAVRLWLGIDEAIARCLIGEARASNLTKLLQDSFEFQNLHPVTNGTRTAIKGITAEVTYIYSVRDRIAHMPCYSDGTSLIFSNALTSKKPEKSITYQCTPQQLIDLSHYVMHITGFIRSLASTRVREEKEFILICAAHGASQRKSDLPKPPGEQHSDRVQKP